MRAGSTRRLGLESWEHQLRNTEAEKEGLCSSEAPSFSDLLLLALSELSVFLRQDGHSWGSGRKRLVKLKGKWGN